MRIGIDLGGTKIEGIALDDQGKERMRHRVATPGGDYAATLQAIAELVEYIEGLTQHTGSVGIGTPGALSPATGLLRNSNSVCMNGQPLKTDLEKILKREIYISNDAIVLHYLRRLMGSRKVQLLCSASLLVLERVLA